MSGGGQQQQTGQTTTVTELPEWARPYAKDILSKGQALTDVNQNPYQTYGAQRIAGFSPMEEQAFSGAANLGPAQAGLAGQGIAAGASLGAMNTGRFGARQAQQYMNPYLESALAPQMELMRRQQGAQAQQMAGQATQAGAFGGSRYGLAQAQQNLANQLAQQNLVGQGYNTAYQNAMAQYNADQARRLQGMQTALQGAGQLGQLGAQQFGQQAQAIGIQGQMGGQQRALEQQGLDLAYQDFLNQQNYPYRQLGFMSDLLRGTPTGQSATTNMYQAPGSMVGQLANLGMGAYAANRAFPGLFGAASGGEIKEYADGGEVDGYAEGGRTDLDMLSDDQLKLSYKNALARGDIGLAQAIQAQLAENTAMRNAREASLTSGLGYAFDQLPTDQQEAVIRAAGGGIVAFAGDDRSDVQEEKKPMSYGEQMSKVGEFLMSIPKHIVSAPGYGFSDQAKPKAAATPASAPTSTPYSELPATRRSDYVDEPSTKAPSKKAAAPSGIADTVRQKAKEMGVEDEYEKHYQKFLNQFNQATDAQIKSITDLLNKRVGDLDKRREQGFWEALMQGSFAGAAKAAEPGKARNRGLLGELVEGLSGGAPTFAAAAAQNRKDLQKEQDLDTEMRIKTAQLEASLRKGDMGTARQLANDIETRKLQKEQIQVQRDRNAAWERVMASRAGASGNKTDLEAFKQLSRAKMKALEMTNKSLADPFSIPKPIREQFKNDPNGLKNYLYNQNFNMIKPFAMSASSSDDSDKLDLDLLGQD